VVLVVGVGVSFLTAEYERCSREQKLCGVSHATFREFSGSRRQLDDMDAPGDSRQ